MSKLTVGSALTLSLALVSGLACYDGQIESPDPIGDTGEQVVRTAPGSENTRARHGIKDWQMMAPDMTGTFAVRGVGYDGSVAFRATVSRTPDRQGVRVDVSIPSASSTLVDSSGQISGDLPAEHRDLFLAMAQEMGTDAPRGCFGSQAAAGIACAFAVGGGGIPAALCVVALLSYYEDCF